MAESSHQSDEQAKSTKEGIIPYGFRRFSQWISHTAGTPWTFVGALLLIVIWAFCGPVFHYSDTWQLVINTGTTIITFLMVFIIQNTQNRDGRAIQLKLDELIRVQTNARNHLIDLEGCSDSELDELQKQFENVRNQRHGTHNQ